ARWETAALDAGFRRRRRRIPGFLTRSAYRADRPTSRRTAAGSGLARLPEGEVRRLPRELQLRGRGRPDVLERTEPQLQQRQPAHRPYVGRERQPNHVLVGGDDLRSREAPPFGCKPEAGRRQG